MTGTAGVAEAPVLDFGFILKALGYGAMGITAIVLCLSYLLVRQLVAADPPRPALDGTLVLVQKYMRFALVCTALMAVFQLTDQVMRVYTDRKLETCRKRVLSPEAFQAIGEWHWQWGEGGWETKAKFMSAQDGAFSFAATTVHKDAGGAVPIMAWESSAPIQVSDDDTDIVFLGKRKVIAPDDLRMRLNLGPRQEYSTRFTLKRSFALTGSYSGPKGEGPFGDIMLYAPRK
jgi:hypothetical protein